MTPEQAEAYKAAIRAQQAQLISAETLEKGIGWLKKLEKEHLKSGFKALSDYLQQSPKTRHLKKTLATYKTFASLSPKERETWNCMPTTYENIKRLNDAARECCQQLKLNQQESDFNERYQQLCLDLRIEDPSR